jgi:hypothetical protein
MLLKTFFFQRKPKLGLAIVEKERTKEQTNKQTNKRTNEQTNKRTSKQTNERREIRLLCNILMHFTCMDNLSSPTLGR